MIDILSREICPFIDFFIFSVELEEIDDRKTIVNRRNLDGLHGKFVQWSGIEGTNASYAGIDPQEIPSCISDLDLLLCDPNPVVSSMVVGDKNQASESSSPSVLDCVLNIMEIKDKSSLSQHNTLNNLGLDSIMTTDIKQTLEKDYGLIFSPKEIRLLTVQRLYEL